MYHGAGRESVLLAACDLDEGHSERLLSLCLTYHAAGRESILEVDPRFRRICGETVDASAAGLAQPTKLGENEGHYVHVAGAASGWAGVHVAGAAVERRIHRSENCSLMSI